ncbi:hypothetical protein MQO_02781 [Staphylococcus aureus subsp. aureus VRS8]|nr:hypothetical protein MQO_02781 [Staphylococcus aureus subsp. aureus VRS8]
MNIKRFRNEANVMNFLLSMHSKIINEENESTISSEIEKKMLEIPLADSWGDYLLLSDEEVNVKLKNLIMLHRRNLQLVIDEKHQEELERIRPSFDQNFDPNPVKRYSQN